MAANSPDINGLILAGGKSSRMGQDKSLLVISGQPQRLRLFTLLKTFCREVYLSCKSGSNVPQDLNPIPDHYPLNSPLNGILSAFLTAPSAAWLTVAVDMPLVDHPTIEFLIRNRNRNKVATCFTDSEGQKPEPLLTIWEPQAFPLLASFYEQGGFSPRQFLAANEITLLTAPDKKILINVNSEEDLRNLKLKDD
ncbi:MAG TPA: NTP transferase domain-containing protein [Cyclobacteriaceae bacterium]